VISSRYDDGFKIYCEQYCARGDIENRIKDQQRGLFADRTSCTHWWPNQWRLILFGFAYTLFECMSAGTLRLKLIKGFWGLSVLKRHNPLQPLSTVASRGVLTFS
jgi:hypothetical protein